MTKRPSSSSSAPSKRQCTTRVYLVAQSGTGANSSTHSTRYTQLRVNDRGRRTQRRVVQQTTTPLVPDDLDPDNEINEWADEPDVENSGPTLAGDASSAPPAQKPKPKKS